MQRRYQLKPSSIKTKIIKQTMNSFAHNQNTMWLLVQILRQNISTAFNTNIGPKYSIIRREDIIEGDMSSSHAERFVRFILNEKLAQGKIIYSAEIKDIVEKKLQQLTSPVPINAMPKSKVRYFLVQFSKGSKDLVQALVSENEVSWPTAIQPNQREVLLFDGQQKRLATVLHMHDDKEYLETEFQKLKQFCFEKAIDESDQDTCIANDEWILALYTCGPTNVVYTILNNNDTYWREGNRYKDVIAYLTDGRNVYQVIIVRKTSNLQELLNQLSIVKSCCLTLDFPLDVDLKRSNAVPPRNFQSLCGSLELFEKYSEINRCSELGPRLNLLENAMRDEAASLIEFVEVLENTRRTLEQRQAIINDSIDFS